MDIEETDPYMLLELIKAIYVEAPDKVQRQAQTEHPHRIHGTDFIPLEELEKKETA